MDDLLYMLDRAALWFRGYENSHRAKGTHDADQKAQTNADRASEIEALVAKYRSKANDRPRP